MSNYTQQSALAALANGNQLAFRGLPIGYMHAGPLNLNVSAAMYNAAALQRLSMQTQPQAAAAAAAVAAAAVNLRRTATLQSGNAAQHNYSQSQSSTPKLRTKTYPNNNTHRSAVTVNTPNTNCTRGSNTTRESSIAVERNATAQPSGRPNSNTGQPMAEKVTAEVSSVADGGEQAAPGVTGNPQTQENGLVQSAQLSRTQSVRSSRSSTASSTDNSKQQTNTTTAGGAGAHHLEHFVEVNGERISKTNVYIRGLPADTSDDDLRRLCAEFGEIVSVRAVRDETTRACRGFGFVDFRRANDAQRAEGELTRRGLAASLARIQHADETNLYLQNLPPHVRERQLTALCARFGSVVSTCVLRDLATGVSKRVGFVRMRSKPECEAVIQALHLHPWPADATEANANANTDSAADVDPGQTPRSVNDHPEEWLEDDTDAQSHKDHDEPQPAATSGPATSPFDSRTVLLVKYADDPLAKRQKRLRASAAAAPPHTAPPRGAPPVHVQSTPSVNLTMPQTTPLLTVPQSVATGTLGNLFAPTLNAYYPALGAYYRQAQAQQILLNASPLYAAAALQNGMALNRPATNPMLTTSDTTTNATPVGVPSSNVTLSAPHGTQANVNVGNLHAQPMVQQAQQPTVTTAAQYNSMMQACQQTQTQTQYSYAQQPAVMQYAPAAVAFQPTSTNRQLQPANVTGYSQVSQPGSSTLLQHESAPSTRVSTSTNASASAHAETRASLPRTGVQPAQQNANHAAARGRQTNRASTRSNAQSHVPQGATLALTQPHRGPQTDDNVNKRGPNSQNSVPMPTVASQQVVQAARNTFTQVSAVVQNPQIAQNQNVTSNQTAPILISNQNAMQMQNVHNAYHSMPNNTPMAHQLGNTVYIQQDGNYALASQPTAAYYQAYHSSMAGHMDANAAQCDYVVAFQQPQMQPHEQQQQQQQQHAMLQNVTSHGTLQQPMAAQGATPFLNGPLVRVGMPDAHATYAMNMNMNMNMGLPQPGQTVYVGAMPPASVAAGQLHATQPYSTLSVQQTAPVAQNSAPAGQQQQGAMQVGGQHLLHTAAQNAYPIAIGYAAAPHAHAHYAPATQTGYFFQPAGNVQLR